MKWYEYLLVIVLVVFSSAVSYGLAYREIHKPIYVVDLTKLIDEQFNLNEVEKVYNKQITPEEFLKRKREYLNKIQSILENLDRPVFVKQAVFGRNTIDITDKVKEYLKR